MVNTILSKNTKEAGFQRVPRNRQSFRIFRQKIVDSSGFDSMQCSEIVRLQTMVSNCPILLYGVKLSVVDPNSNCPFSIHSVKLSSNRILFLPVSPVNSGVGGSGSGQTSSSPLLLSY